ncbi:tRNA (adenosine(37)-N6)-dimethylallyltransferase MiaA [Bordetella genomosp. 9]|uniref:tRNA dimethylallyltransferase n=1 Tax=Bordetella genomosp. 9 TaxID=1416803 RepID=A0A1W6Z444_9BORD|nr:tRNA (adenosine(37)-N6)-dimethylallyltransferase MiaA [Bordetella genomosp. 9]ARP87593.1 tRNA (adenosine(37)-N6)-dimethylallyltransferase MiaA [Bordetella genomosp. 9]
MTPRPILCLTGPTAAGKSAATLALARRWPIEIINVDSATIYRGMDIGTAKPSAEERERVPQHLLDIRDPAQNYSAADFRADALRLIDAIHERGRMPVLAGGTMLYFKALREGLDDLPSADPALRTELERRAADAGWPAMHQELARLDPVTAARLAPNDSQRIQRALEVCLVSGQPMSALLQRAARQRAQSGGAPQTQRYVTISLEPSDRSALHARIAQRFDLMLAQGLIDEVRALRARGDLHAGLPSVRCVGYRQMWSYLEGEMDLEEARASGIAATRQLAKRQLTWLRAQPDRMVVDCLAPDAADQVIRAWAEVLG